VCVGKNTADEATFFTLTLSSHQSNNGLIQIHFVGGNMQNRIVDKLRQIGSKIAVAAMACLVALGVSSV